MKFLFSFLFISMILCLTAQTPQVLNLANANLRLRWENSGSGWRIKTIAVKKGQTWVNLEQPSGEHTLLYSADKPKTEPDSGFKSVNGQKARLIVDKNIVKIDHPTIDYLLASTEKKDKVFVILMNNRAQATDFEISIKRAAGKTKQLPALGFEILTITP